MICCDGCSKRVDRDEHLSELAIPYVVQVGPGAIETWQERRFLCRRCFEVASHRCAEALRTFSPRNEPKPGAKTQVEVHMERMERIVADWPTTNAEDRMSILHLAQAVRGLLEMR